MPNDGPSRRRAIQLSGSALLAALAGCPGDQGGAETETDGGTPTAEPGPATETETETAAVESPETETVEPENPETETAETETAAVESPETETPVDATPALSVSDQETSGETLTVESATINRAGWLVVHPESNGGPDATTNLAAVALEPGQSTDVEVPLDESVSEDQTLYAMLHYDDPADGEFTFTPDNGEDPPVTADGEPVVEAFDVTVT